MNSNKYTKTRNNRILIIVSLLLLIITIMIVFISVRYLFGTEITIDDPYPKNITPGEFSSRWKNANYEQRMKLLPTLFQEKFDQNMHSEHLLDKSLINGMSKEEIIEFLGQPDSIIERYDSGVYVTWLQYNVGDMRKKSRINEIMDLYPFSGNSMIIVMRKNDSGDLYIYEIDI